MTLEAKNLARALSIRGEVRVLVADVSLQVGPGDILGVTGPSGCGKSTLLRLIMGLDARSAGSVALDGKPILPADLPGFRAVVAMLAQAPGRPAGTARDLAAELAIDPTPSLDPLGLAPELLDVPWTKLSGGEARRLRLAFLVATEPRYLVLDEPSSGLDAANGRRLAQFLLDQASAGRGVLVVSHDELLLARCASRMQILYEGEIQGEGTPDELIPAACAEAGRGGDQ